MNELLPEHTSAEIESLEEDLAAHGLKVSVVTDDAGNVIDGKLRAKLCERLGIDWRATAKTEGGLTEGQKAALRLKLNILRRSTPPKQKQRREYVRTLLQAEPELSNGSIGKLCGVDHSTVSRVRSEMEIGGEARPVTATTGVDGIIRQKPRRPEPVRSIPKHARARPSAIKIDDACKSEFSSHMGDAEADEVALCAAPSMDDETDDDEPVGRLESVGLTLRLTKAVAVQDDRWEWIAQDDDGNSYHLTCRCVQAVAHRTLPLAACR